MTIKKAELDLTGIKTFAKTYSSTFLNLPYAIFIDGFVMQLKATIRL